MTCEAQRGVSAIGQVVAAKKKKGDWEHTYTFKDLSEGNDYASYIHTYLSAFRLALRCGASFAAGNGKIMTKPCGCVCVCVWENE